MYKRDESFYFVDIFIAHNKIVRYIKKFDNAQDLLWSELEWDATIRELEIIGEATNTLIKQNVIKNQKFRKIVDFRNLVIHGYFGIDENEVWEVLQNKLDIFINDLKIIIEEKNINLTLAINYAKNENTKNQNIINFLNSLSTTK